MHVGFPTYSVVVLQYLMRIHKFKFSFNHFTIVLTINSVEKGNCTSKLGIKIPSLIVKLIHKNPTLETGRVYLGVDGADRMQVTQELNDA